MIKSVLITGANSGLGKEAARQLAAGGASKVILGCRNPEKAEAAKRDLERSTGRSVFEILLVDVSRPQSVRDAVTALAEPVQGLLMNAGGLGGSAPSERTAEGATRIFAGNVLGHVVLFEELMAAEKLTQVALFAGAEAARGIPMLRMSRPELSNTSVEELVSVIDGSFFGDSFSPISAFPYVKYMAALWMGSAARQYPRIRIATISPGGSVGSAMSDVPPMQRFLLTTLMQPLLKAFGKFHDLETGAKRYVDALNDDSLSGGLFYGAPYPGLTGELVDQSTIFADLADHAYQDNAREAISRFIPER